MPVFYVDVNRREFFNAPQYTRQNHRFRGPRESEKVNLEITQMYFSINRLYNLTANLRQRYLELADLLLTGGTISEDLLDEDDDAHVLEGIEPLVDRTALLERRLKSLTLTDRPYVAPTQP